MYKEKGQQLLAGSLLTILLKRRKFLQDLVTIVEMEEIPPPKAGPNWHSWTMHDQGTRRVEIIGLSDKRQITAVFCGNLLGKFLLTSAMQSELCASLTEPCIEGAIIWFSLIDNLHRSTEDAMVEYVILPFVECRRDMLGKEKATVVIMDNFKGKVTEKTLKLLDEHNIFTT